MNEALATVTEVLDDGTCIVSVEGEIDLETAPRFETVLRVAIEAAAHRLIVDLTGCGFLDSSGLNVLVRTRKQLNDGGSLAVVATHPMLRKVFEITHLDGVFEIHPTRAEAMNGSRPATRRDGHSDGRQHG